MPEYENSRPDKTYSPISTDAGPKGRSRPAVPVLQRQQQQTNQTGLPDQLKAGVEDLSGISLADVQVHYHSDKPAQLNAFAYAQGNQIHVAPGQEKHLPHEAWHVVQQKQQRVAVTTAIPGKNLPVNDDPALEKEADIMGEKALDLQRTGDAAPPPQQPLQLRELETVRSRLNGHNGIPQLASARLLVEDGTIPGEGQISKNDFLGSLRAQVVSLAKEILEPVGLAQANCPDLNYWISFYTAKDAAYKEQAIMHYAPAAAEAGNYHDMLSALSARIRQGLVAHVATGSHEVEPGPVPDEVAEKRPVPAEAIIQQKSADPIQFGLCGTGNNGGVAVISVIDQQTMNELNGSRPAIDQLYADGASSGQITYLLTRQPDATILHTQITVEANRSPLQVYQLYRAGASSAQVSYLLTCEANAGTLHNLVTAEATHSVAAIEQLYRDGANTACITYLLTRETNGDTLHTQVMAEAARSAAAIEQLYRDGAVSAHITYLLTRETNAGTLHAQVQAEAARDPVLIRQLYTDGCSSAVVTELLTYEADAQKLHDQLQRESSHTPAMLISLYKLPLNSGQVDALLAAERDGQTVLNIVNAEETKDVANLLKLYNTLGASTAQVNSLLRRNRKAAEICALIEKENARSPAKVIRLLRDGLNFSQVNAVLDKETNADEVHNIIQLETSQYAPAIHDLYMVNATSAQIRDLLALEPNGHFVQALLDREATKNVDNIKQLYADGCNTQQIAGMLWRQQDGALLHTGMQQDATIKDQLVDEAVTDFDKPVDARFTPATLRFASASDGRFGSIYFDIGRIRLTHPSQPEISIHANGINRFTISNADSSKYNKWKRETEQRTGHAPSGHDKFVYIRDNCPSRAVAVRDVGEKLIEFFGVEGAGGSHPSRGGPVSFPVLTQKQINIIFTAAQHRNNTVLRLAMLAEGNLSRLVPVN